VRQIEAAALKKIQAAEECRDLREFLSAWSVFEAVSSRGDSPRLFSCHPQVPLFQLFGKPVPAKAVENLHVSWRVSKKTRSTSPN
jgi:hypothetical protein